MSEKRMDDRLLEAARAINAPPATPREELWARIEAVRTADLLRRRRRAHHVGWIRWGVGIAAVLLVGIQLGRLAERSRAPAAERAARSAPAPALAYRMTATQHLTQAEALLTQMKTQTAAQRLDEQTTSWARDLLATTRLLLDSPAADEPRLRVLLEDLELVLAQIAQLPTNPARDPAAVQELDLLRESIEQGSMLPRLRTAIPAGAPAAAS